MFADTKKRIQTFLLRTGVSLAVLAGAVIAPGPSQTATAASPIDYLYKYSYQGQGVGTTPGGIVTLEAFAETKVYLDLRNEGIATWENRGPFPFRLGTDQPHDGPSPFAGRDWLSSIRPAPFQQKVTGGAPGSRTLEPASRILPGETARFEFTVRAPNVTGNFRLHVQPVVDSFTWAPQNFGIYWEIRTTAQRFSYQYVTQSAAAPSAPGASATMYMAVRNTGTTAWSNANDGNTIKLAPSRPTDRASLLYDSSWESGSRVGSFRGRMKTDSAGAPLRGGTGLQYDIVTTINPGEVAYFEFTGRAPSRMVAANEYFTLLIEGKTWLPDIGVYWPLQVGQGYQAAWVGQSSQPVITLEDGPWATVYFDYRNTGSFPWQKDGVVRLAPVNPRDRLSRFAVVPTLQSPIDNLPAGALSWNSASRVGTFAGKVVNGSVDSSVQTINPGETARFMVTLKADAVPLGMYREHFSLVADGFSWLRDYGAYQDVTVRRLSTPTPAAGNPFAGASFYVDPNGPAKTQADAWRATRPADAAQIDKIATNPRANWFGSWSGDIQTAINNKTTQITGAGALPVYVAYNIPQRDCGQYSAGGANSPDGYRAWINGFAAGLADRKAVIILEPDGVSLNGCLSVADKQTRYELLSYAVTTLQSRGGIVYIDAGHAGWHSAAEMASRLNQAGLAQARGFSLNVSNFGTTTNEGNYAVQISNLTGGKTSIIDTSRNGLGPTTDNQWCNPAGRALGSRPSANTGSAVIDAFYWVKQPGESDGTCNGGPGAGQWWGDYALGLAQRATQFNTLTQLFDPSNTEPMLAPLSRRN